MLGRDLLAEESGLLEGDCRNGRVIGQEIALSHCLILDDRAIGLE